MYIFYQLRFFFPDKISAGPCKWVLPSQFGGGLVPNDRYTFDVKIGTNCCILFTSQSSTKVFSPTATSKGPACQDYKWTVQDSALLSVLADPVVPFRGSSLKQSHSIHLDANANLIFLDWFTAGRINNKELWEFELLESLVRMYSEDKLVVREALKLSDTTVSIKESMSPYNVYGALIIWGPRIKEFYSKISREIESQKFPPGNNSVSFLVAASPLYSDRRSRFDEDPQGCILKFSSTTTSKVYEWLQEIFTPLFPLYGANPFHLK